MNMRRTSRAFLMALENISIIYQMMIDKYVMRILARILFKQPMLFSKNERIRNIENGWVNRYRLALLKKQDIVVPNKSTRNSGNIGTAMKERPVEPNWRTNNHMIIRMTHRMMLSNISSIWSKEKLHMK